ncbi:MAG: SUMF1/EgtB/PvdO family nonheme iron enzyme [Anaerolineae bacterium]|nr:SUMF1/EgtB/PvdO family nonheme iron enzyme [Anaerolineae bacterium]
MSLPPKLRKELLEKLEDHVAFESNDNLRVLFKDVRLKPWRNRVKDKDSPLERAIHALDVVIGQSNRNGDNALVLLLTVLQEGIDEENALYVSYEQYIDRVKDNFFAKQPEVIVADEPIPEQSGSDIDAYHLPLIPEMPDMVMIPAGPFWMGSEMTDPSAYDNEKPRHEVYLGGYWIGRYPVTNVEYAVFLRQTGYKHEELTEAELLVKPDHPVTKVSKADAEAYCQWLSRVWERPFRLPTEQEWEKAARGSLPETRLYVWGNLWQGLQANTKEAGHALTTAVTQYKASNSSPYDVVDLLGNVWEWTASRYAPYQHSPHDSIDFGKTRFVIRGGSWINDWRKARISTRGRYAVETRRSYLGFRLVADALSVDKAILQKQMADAFNLNELKDLCLILELPHEEFLPPLNNMVRELILYCERHNQLKTLVDACQQRRPKVIWFKPSTP